MPASAARNTAPAPAHLYELDVVRLLTFASVIGVHTLTYVAGQGTIINGVGVLLHFTRGVFFALTAFLLTRSAYRKPRSLAEFWPRRYLLVGVPYIAWTALYVLIWTFQASTRPGLAVIEQRFAGALLRGSAAEHMYFLLVTLQVYLVIPAVIWGLRRFPRLHLPFLALAFVFQLIVFTAAQYFPTQLAAHSGHSIETINSALLTSFPTYIFFIAAGAVAGSHADRFLVWVRTHRTLIAALVSVSGTVTVIAYALQQHLGMSSGSAASEMQPVELLWTVAVGAGLLALGTLWADHRRDGAFDDRFLRWASDRSFGIFLSHAAWIMIIVAVGINALPLLLRVPLGYVTVAVAAALTAEVFRRTPLSLPLTGRPMVRWRRPKTTTPPAGAAPPDGGRHTARVPVHAGG